MKTIKRLCVILITLSMGIMSFTACGKQGDASTGKETESQIETDVTTDTTESIDADDTEDVETVETITVEEAIELVKGELGEEFTYVPAEELEEKDGSQYYVIYVNNLLEEGNLTTLTTYLVKTDGSEFFDKYVTSLYVGEYVHTGETGETVFKVFEDNTFEMITTGVVNQVISGVYKFGITDSATVFVLELYPKKVVTEYNGETKEEDVTDGVGTAIIEDGKLTLTMESMDTIFTKINQQEG